MCPLIQKPQEKNPVKNLRKILGWYLALSGALSRSLALSGLLFVLSLALFGICPHPLSKNLRKNPC